MILYLVVLISICMYIVIFKLEVLVCVALSSVLCLSFKGK